MRSTFHEEASSSNRSGACTSEHRRLRAIRRAGLRVLWQGQRSAAGAGSHQGLGREWRDRAPCWSLYFFAIRPLLGRLFTVLRVGKLYSLHLAGLVPAGLMLSDAELE